MSQSTLPALNDFKSVDSCVDKAFEVSGYIGNAQNGWFLQGALTDGCVSLGPNLQLSATSLRVQSAAPQVSFTTVVTLPQTQDLTFQMTGTFADSSGAVTVQLSGNSQSVYQTHVGVDPLEIDNVNLQLSVSMGAGAGAFSAQMSGAVTIDDQTEVAASSSFDSSAKALSFSLTIHEDKSVLLFNLLKLLIGQQAFDNIPMPQSGKDKLMGVYLVQGTMALSTQPPALSGGLQVLAFYKLLVSASLSFNDGKFAFGFSVQPESGLLDPIKLSDILPNVRFWSLCPCVCLSVFIALTVRFPVCSVVCMCSDLCLHCRSPLWTSSACARPSLSSPTPRPRSLFPASRRHTMSRLDSTSPLTWRWTTQRPARRV